MLLETTTALYQRLCSVNEDSNVFKYCGDKGVTVLMAEKYREILALQEKDKNQKIRYPIIVLYDGEMAYDRSRYYNDMVDHPTYAEQNSKGETVLKRKVDEPYMPYNLSYRIEIICKQRIHLDNILLWFMRYIPERGSLDVPYTDADGNDDIYNSLLRRGPIVKADEGTSSVLYRRISELQLTTLLDGKEYATYALAEHLKIEEKGDF